MKSRLFELRSWFLIALAAALGCGGKGAVRDNARTRENEAGADLGGSAGASGSAGRGGQAGGGRAGTAAASGSGGSMAAGSAGMPAGDKCALPAPELRSCDGFPFFFHDVNTGECVPVEGSKCPDDLQRIFGSLAECLTECSSARPAANACDAASDCIVA